MSKSVTKKKIVFDASPLLVNRTGIAYYIEQFIPALARQKPNWEFIGFYYNFLGRRSAAHFPQAPNISYRPVKFIPSKVVYQARRWGVQIPVELLAKTKADFILYPNFLGYPSLFKTPSAPVIHDTTFLDLPEYVARKNQQDLERFVPQTLARSNFVITVSDFSKQKIIKTYHTPSEQLLVTPIPPLPVTKLSEQQRQKCLDEMHITGPYLATVGTIEPRKNILTLLQAYQLLPSALQKEYALVVAGRVGWNCQEEVSALKRLSQSHNVNYVGFISDEQRTALYQSANAFTSASFYEGFGMPVLEAMSYGLPCAVSDIAVYHEVAGDSALYFDQQDPQSIANTLAKLLGDKTLQSDYAKRSHQKAASYHWEPVAQKVIGRIAAIIGE